MSQQAAQAIVDVIGALGPSWIAPPVLQPTALYLELLGEDLRARAYLLADDDGLCLRPDMTAPAVRLALATAEWKVPFAVGYDGLVFRRQSDRTRETEFRQIGVERFGPRHDLAKGEADLIVTAVEACKQAGVNPHLRLGDVALFDALIDAFALGEVWTRRLKRAFARPGGLSAALRAAGSEIAPVAALHPLAQALAALPAARAEAVVEDMLNEARIVPVGGRTVAEVAARLREKGLSETAPAPPPSALTAIGEAVALEGAPDKALAALAALARGARMPEGAVVEEALERTADRCRTAGVAESATFSIGFGRGLAYYDGSVFELEAPALGARASLGGGGRYDGLLHRIAAGEGRAAMDGWGAMGFALRPQRIAEAAS